MQSQGGSASCGCSGSANAHCLNASPLSAQPVPALQAGSGLAESVVQAANVLLSKGKDAVAAAQRAVRLAVDWSVCGFLRSRHGRSFSSARQRPCFVR